MSALGQKQTFALQKVMSALARKRTSRVRRIPLGSLALAPVDRTTSYAVRAGKLAYQVGEAAGTKLSIKNLFDAFYAFIMR